jgi:hypothetical protein
MKRELIIAASAFGIILSLSLGIITIKYELEKNYLN